MLNLLGRLKHASCAVMVRLTRAAFKSFYDLTAKKSALYWKVVESKKAKTCWTQDGNIFALKQDGRKIRIMSERDIEKV